jgi:N-carbamoylputrescine amidase
MPSRRSSHGASPCSRGARHIGMARGRRGRHELRVGLVQTRVGEDVARNLEQTDAAVADAARRGAEIVCLQELFATRYFAQIRHERFLDWAEPIPGRTSRFLSDCAARHRVTLVGGSLYERARGGRRYNTTLVFDAKGRRIGKYRKMHIPHDPNYYEQDYFAPGNLGYVQVKTPRAVIAPLICYDQWFPEAARMNVLRGAQVLFYPTAIGWFPEMQRDEPFSARRWERAMCAHASLNGVFAVAVNRVGREDGLRFWGGSFVADPFGEVVARASSSRPEVLVADLDLRKIRESQQGWGFLANRRPDSYREPR